MNKPFLRMSSTHVLKKAFEKRYVNDALRVLSKNLGIGFRLLSKEERPDKSDERPDFVIESGGHLFGLEHRLLYPDQSAAQLHNLTQEFAGRISSTMKHRPGRFYAFDLHKPPPRRSKIKEVVAATGRLIDALEKHQLTDYIISGKAFSVTASPVGARGVHPRSMVTENGFRVIMDETTIVEQIVKAVCDKDAKAKEYPFSGPVGLILCDPTPYAWDFDSGAYESAQKAIDVLTLTRLKWVWFYRRHEALYPLH